MSMLRFPETTRPTREALTTLVAYGYTGDGPARFIDVDGHTLFVAGAEGGELKLNITGPRSSIAGYPVIFQAIDGTLHNLYVGGPVAPGRCTGEDMGEVIPSLGGNLCGEPHPKHHSMTFRYSKDGRLVVGTGVDLVHMRVYERLQRLDDADVTTYDDYRPGIAYGDSELVASVAFADRARIEEMMANSGATVKFD